MVIIKLCNVVKKYKCVFIWRYDMTHKYKVYDELERLSILSPIPFYWTDVNGVIVGVNKYCFDLAMNLLSPDLIGKSAHDIYTPESAAIVDKHIKMVMKAQKSMSFEEELVDQITFKRRSYVSYRSPLFEGNKVIGVVACVTEITTQKEAERLQIEIVKHKTKLETQEKFIAIINEFNHLLQKYKFDILNEDLGIKKQLNEDCKHIHLSKREQEILYYLSLNQSTKDIATILSILDKTSILPSTIQSTINKRLYTKFDVLSVSQLIEKANSMKLIPFFLTKNTKE